MYFSKERQIASICHFRRNIVKPAWKFLSLQIAHHEIILQTIVIIPTNKYIVDHLFGDFCSSRSGHD